MEPPENTNLPFFAYGLFKPGQLGYHQIEPFVCEPPHEEAVEGVLFERDGVPLLDESFTSSTVKGYLIEFDSASDADDAYNRIGKAEPGSQYVWEQTNGKFRLDGGEKSNILIGKRASDGGQEIYSENWDGGQDPLFNCALEIVEDIREGYADVMLDPGNPDLESFFRIQMAYSLLWSSIERYASLRHGSEEGVNARLRLAASNNRGFADGFENVDKSDYRPLFRTDRPQNRPWEFRPDDPEKAMMYYYRVRSNLFHRGKRASMDFDLLKLCLEDLHDIFQNHVLPESFGPDWQRNSC